MRRMLFVIFLVIITVLCGCSQNSKEVKIGFEFNTGEKDNTPYTEVIFKFLDKDKKEDKISVGIFSGTTSIVESFENSMFFNKNSLIGCQVFYAGGGDNIFVYLEGKKLIIKHIEFVLGNDGMEGSVIKDEIVATKEITNGVAIVKYD